MRAALKALAGLTALATAAVVPPPPGTESDLRPLVLKLDPDNAQATFGVPCSGCLGEGAGFGDDEALLFDFQALPADVPCGASNITLNGSQLNQTWLGQIAKGHGTLSTFPGPVHDDLSHDYNLVWESACIDPPASSEPKRESDVAQILKVTVQTVDGKELSDPSGFTISFKQLPKPQLLRLSTFPDPKAFTPEFAEEWRNPPARLRLTIASEDLDQLADYWEVGKQNGHSIEADIEELRLLEQQASELYQKIREKRQKIRAHFRKDFKGLKEELQECDSLTCVVKVIVHKAHGALRTIHIAFQGPPGPPPEMGVKHAAWHRLPGQEFSGFPAPPPGCPPPPPPHCVPHPPPPPGNSSHPHPPPPADCPPPPPPHCLHGHPPPPGHVPHHGPPHEEPPHHPEHPPHGHPPHHEPGPHHPPGEGDFSEAHHHAHPWDLPPRPPRHGPHGALIMTAKLIAGLCCCTALFTVIKRKWCTLRQRTERRARREERRTARQYRRAARRHAWREWWARHRPGQWNRFHWNDDYEEKRALILEQEGVLEQAMQDEIRQLREAHGVVNSIVSAEEGRCRTLSSSSRVAPRYTPAPYGYSGMAAPRFVAQPMARSDSLPGYRSDAESNGTEPPAYEEDEGSDLVADGFREYTPSSTSSGIGSEWTPESSVIDVSPRQSMETMRERYMSDGEESKPASARASCDKKGLGEDE